MIEEYSVTHNVLEMSLSRFRLTARNCTPLISDVTFYFIIDFHKPKYIHIFAKINTLSDLSMRVFITD